MTSTTSSLAQDLIRIHKVITRGLNVGLSKGNEHLRSGFPSSQAQQGYASYLHCLAAVLGTHHESEDQIAFPAFQQVIPSAPYARLTADHQKIESRLTKTPIWIKDLSGENSEFALRELMNILREISRLWIPHIMVEEEYFAQEALNAVMSPEEQGRIGTAASQYSQEHSGPPYWVVPFILYNLELDERKIMAANFPPTIIDELVPKVWKDQWAPMKPYLLD